MFGPSGDWYQYRNLASYRYAANVTGAIVITTPMLAVGYTTMFRVQVDLYLYGQSGPGTVILAGYYYDTGGTFVNLGLIRLGKFASLRVRLAREIATNKIVIIIGETTDSIYYPHVLVSSLETHAEGMETGWSIAQVTSLAAYDKVTEAPDVTFQAPPVLAPGNQETGVFGLALGNVSAVGQLALTGVNFKTVMSNVPSSITIETTLALNLSAITIEHITKYGFRAHARTTAVAEAHGYYTYTTVGN